jgi:serine/threonine protein kinase
MIQQDFLTETANARILLGQQVGEKGGEGTVYRVVGLPTTCAKVYHSGRLLGPDGQRYSAKLTAMLANPLAPTLIEQRRFAIAWPQDRLLVSSTRSCVGFTMPFHSGSALQSLYVRGAAEQLSGSYKERLTIAANLSRAVEIVHEAGHIIGDLDGKNVLVLPASQIALIDADSFQLSSGKDIFKSIVGKPEFLPPELQGQSLRNVVRKREHDAFALAVIVFRLLMFEHPFANRRGGSTSESIRDGAWAYDSRDSIARWAPPRAPPFDAVPIPLQTLMRRCFVDGHSQPNKRPTAAEWRSSLDAVIADVCSCALDARHTFHARSTGCPWCAYFARQASSATSFVGRGGTTGHIKASPGSASQPPPPPPTPRNIAQGSRRRNRSGFRGRQPRHWRMLLASILVVGGLYVASAVRESTGGLATVLTHASNTSESSSPDPSARAVQPPRTDDRVASYRPKRENPQWGPIPSSPAVGWTDGRSYDSAGSTDPIGTNDLSRETQALISYRRGISNYESGDYFAAENDFTETIRLKPRSAQSYHFRALAKERLADLFGALGDMDTSIDLRPNYAEAYHARAIFNERLGFHLQAIRDIQTAMRLAPTNVAFRKYYDRLRGTAYHGTVRQYPPGMSPQW